jgi:hypothetical protein
MDESTRSRIRRIFLSLRPSFALMPAAELLGLTLKELKREIEDGAIVAVSTRLAQRIPREEMMAVAMQVWEQAVIEEALGDDAAAVLPEVIRLVELRAQVPRYQWEMLRYLARRDGTTATTCWHASWRTSPARTPRNWRPPCPGSRPRWRGHERPCRTRLFRDPEMRV